MKFIELKNLKDVYASYNLPWNPNLDKMRSKYFPDVEAEKIESSDSNDSQNSQESDRVNYKIKGIGNHNAKSYETDEDKNKNEEVEENSLYKNSMGKEEEEKQETQCEHPIR